MQVVCGAKVFFSSKIVCRVEHESFGQLLSRLEGKRFAEKEVHNVGLFEDGIKAKGHVEVGLHAPLKLCTQEYFHCSTFVIHLVEQESPEPSCGFDTLMSSQKRILLPKKCVGDKLRADKKMRNDYIDLLSSWSVGWTSDSVQTLGEHSVKTIVLLCDTWTPIVTASRIFHWQFC